MGMPLVSATLEGNGADDPLYLPAWQKMVKVIGHKNFIIRSRLQSWVDCNPRSNCSKWGYLLRSCAHSFCNILNTSFNGYSTHQQRLWRFVYQGHDEVEPAVGKGFEVELGKFWLNKETNSWVRWHERYLVVYSQSLAGSTIRGQQQRINTAQTALNNLAAKPGQDREQLSHKVENILKRYRVKDFFSTMITEEISKQTRHVGL
jgi:transposase